MTDDTQNDIQTTPDAAPPLEAPAPEPTGTAPASEATAAPTDHGHGGLPEADGQLVSAYTHGGHELDQHSISSLFVFLLVLGLLVVFSGIGTMQLFRAQTDQSMAESANRPMPALNARQDADRSILEGYRAVDTKQGVYGIPVEKATDMVLKQPTRLKASPAPAGWIHPDDVQQ